MQALKRKCLLSQEMQQKRRKLPSGPIMQRGESHSSHIYLPSTRRIAPSGGSQPAWHPHHSQEPQTGQVHQKRTIQVLQLQHRPQTPRSDMSWLDQAPLQDTWGCEAWTWADQSCLMRRCFSGSVCARAACAGRAARLLTQRWLRHPERGGQLLRDQVPKPGLAAWGPAWGVLGCWGGWPDVGQPLGLQRGGCGVMKVQGVAARWGQRARGRERS